MAEGQMAIEGKTGMRLTSAELQRSPNGRYSDDLLISIIATGHNYTEGNIEFGVRENFPFSFQSAQPTFRRICEECRISGSQDWTSIIGRINNGISFAPIIENFFRTLNTTSANIHKAAFLLYIWMESSFVLHDPDDIERKIFDEFVVNYRGQLGTQTYLYFLPRRFVTPTNEPFLQILYDKCLLCRFTFAVPSIAPFRTYFIPLVRLTEGPNTFDTAQASEISAKRLYHSIKHACTIKVRNHFEELK